MVKCNNEGAGTKSSAFFYGWYIVGVGILVALARENQENLTRS